jgi:hypothetical protein
MEILMFTLGHHIRLPNDHLRFGVPCKIRNHYALFPKVCVQEGASAIPIELIY